MVLIPTTAISDFKVFIKHEGYCCHVRAEGMANSLWLLKCLSQSFAFKTSNPLIETGPPSYCNFQVAYGSHLSRRGLENLFMAIPGVRLSVDPGSKQGR